MRWFVTNIIYNDQIFAGVLAVAGVAGAALLIGVTIWFSSVRRDSDRMRRFLPNPKGVPASTKVDRFIIVAAGSLILAVLMLLDL